MNNIYDKAHELAQVLKQDETVCAYREAVQKIESDASKKKMVEDFRAIQFEAYQAKMTKGEVGDETKKRLEDLVAIIQLNPEVTDFLNCEQRFSVLFNDIMKILNDAIGVEIIG
ncbi:hypothetical protein ABB02_01416 [Clostridiaceae bacterium JG1575]|nr:hypothetical protein ABB02_01416 [Clostridiaceae bacterium JG1575]